MILIDIQDVIDLLQMNREEEYKKSLSAECKHKSVIRSKHDAHVAFCDYLIECIKQLPSVQSKERCIAKITFSKEDLERIVKEQIEEIKKELSQKWIPISVKLPEKRQDVIVTVNDGMIYTDTDEWIETGFFAYGHNVIAWMPLPEPWKGEEE